GETRSGS
ncbi:cell envelope integrity inner membrane protein TolA, partial [Haemophilus influenzae]